MQVERDIYVNETDTKRRSPHCLDCEDCVGTCWHLRELQALPSAILRARSAPTREQRQTQ